MMIPKLAIARFVVAAEPKSRGAEIHLQRPDERVLTLVILLGVFAMRLGCTPAGPGDSGLPTFQLFLFAAGSPSCESRKMVVRWTSLGLFFVVHGFFRED